MRDVAKDLAEWDDTIVAISRAVVRRFPMVDWQDVAQTLRLWWMETKRVSKYLDTIEGDDEAEGKVATKKLLRAMQLQASKFCQYEKAATLGYKVDDLFFYSTGALRDILPMVFDYDAWLPFTKSDSSGRSGGDPAEGGNLLATLADVSLALSRLRDSDLVLIESIYQHGLTEAEIATAEDVTVEAINKRHDRALERLRDILGGERPNFHEGPGARRAMSRAAAVAITGSDE